jgi:predicted Zn-dependent peptidase
MAEPNKARAVLSTEDLTLLRQAVLSHLEQIKDTPDSIKFARLYHRLGSAGGK